jgi:hypothetical protein
MHGRMTRRRWTVCALLAPLVRLHAGSTKLVSSWASPDAKGLKFRKVVTIAATRIPGTRRVIEDEMALIMSERGNDAQPSYQLLTELELEDPAKLKATLAASGADGIVVLRLHSFNTKQKDQPQSSGPRTHIGAAGDLPPSFQFNFFETYAEAGELTYQKQVIEVETLVYAFKTEKLVWRGVSRTKNPMGPKIVVQEIAKEVINQMKRQGLIAK